MHVVDSDQGWTPPPRAHTPGCPPWCRGHLPDLDDWDVDVHDGTLSRWHDGPTFGQHVSLGALEHGSGRRELIFTVEAELLPGSALDDLVLDVHAARSWTRLPEVATWVGGGSR